MFCRIYALTSDTLSEFYTKIVAQLVCQNHLEGGDTNAVHIIGNSIMIRFLWTIQNKAKGGILSHHQLDPESLADISCAIFLP